MKRLLSSELRKLRATPTMWWLLGGMILVTVAAVLGAFALQEAGDVPRTSDASVRADLHAIGAGSIFVAIAGIIGTAGEFRFGQADQTYLSHPRRQRVLSAKLVVFGVLGLVFGLVAAAVTVATVWLWFSSKGDSLTWTASVWLTLLGAVLSAVLFGLLGVGIGASTRNQVSGIVAGLAWLVILEPILFQASNAAGRWLPGMSAEALRRVPQEGMLSMATGTGVLVLWVAGALGVGAWRTATTDVV